MLDASLLEISIESPTSDTSRALIDASDDALGEHYSKEECFSVSADDLKAPNVEFFVARRGDQPIGCVALIDHVGYGEVKRLYVTENARGVGVGAALLDAVEHAARDIGLRSIRLETGARLGPAVAIYKARGYRKRGAFGGYTDMAPSLFMEKSL